MSTPTPAGKISVASVSDRGLNKKRPLNEDSFLADAARGIFVVADGVGGAEAGEVASATAVDVLNQAFHQKLAAGDDAEDLMELAIQRANNSIHQMAAEHPRLSSMATTVVALHLDGRTATFGHVGDSRLYRLTPDGKLARETADHSVVEEEVRAGRMTPEQAINHPSKNVISRALGAEASVEVDMKTTEVEDGSTFLLCTDGITRHIPDNQLRELLMSGQSAEAICAEMKQRCFQRGAEDNLTAVIVQVGTPQFDAVAIDVERTVDARLESVPTAPATSETRLAPPSRIAVPAPNATQQPLAVSATAKSSRRGRPVLRFFVFLLFLGVAGGAFYGGMRYQKSLPVDNAAPAQPSPDDRAAAYDKKRAAVDANGQKWLADNLPIQLAKEGIAKAADSKDPEFLYLYGRALMLAGNHREAMQAFDLALTNLRTESKTKLPLDAELKLAAAAAALKAKPKAPSQEAAMAEQKAVRTLDELLGLKTAAAPK
ncbi:MAG TPA: PP2C family serine/threonine-protein phosphatase [Pyrinomonadaceae bacterium]|nr:PP2C family serine/threonine-protein phosphatase [Pyrinomonadaceae bacterium]